MQLLVFLSLAATGLAVRTPYISWISKEQVVDIGSSVQLECSVQYSQDYPVLWVKKGTRGFQDFPISTGPALIIRDHRYSLKHDKGSSTYILQIKDFKESDEGRYLCRIILGINNHITASVSLLVRRPPVISDNSTRSVVASAGDNVELSCYADGMPIPDISWRRENNVILPTGGSIYRGNVLQITNIRKEDRGTYYCIAENQVGRGARRNIHVEVEFAPVVKAFRPRAYQALHYDMDLECNVEAYPPAAIVWFYKQEAIVNNQHYRVSQFATDDEFTDTTLRVLSIEKHQFGNYSCTATNKLGQSSAIVSLIETAVPVCPPACDTFTYSDAYTTTPSSISDAYTTTPSSISDAYTTTPSSISAANTTTPSSISAAYTTTPSGISAANTTTPSGISAAYTAIPSGISAAYTRTPSVLTVVALFAAILLRN